jgi:hypothetical protein
VAITFGNQLCHFQASFSAQDRPQALATSVAIASASGDPHAMVHANGFLVYGTIFEMVPGGTNTTIALPLVPPTTILPGALGVTTISPLNHHFINLLIEENSESFACNNGIWNLSQSFWFGTTDVVFSSFFTSHRVPLAWARARAMSKASGKFIGGSLVPPAAWAVNMPPNYWDL